MKTAGPILVIVGCLAIVVAGLNALRVPEIDRGRCLRPRVERHHTDARWEYTCEPTLDFEMNLSLDCGEHWVPARDWVETFCDEWEFPNGKAERDE